VKDIALCDYCFSYSGFRDIKFKEELKKSEKDVEGLIQKTFEKMRLEELEN